MPHAAPRCALCDCCSLMVNAAARRYPEAMSETPSTAGPLWRRLVGPNWLDLGLLLVGIIAGVVLGPVVLGNVAPGYYIAWFQGGADEVVALREFDEQRAALRADYPTDTALDVFDAQTRRDRRPLEAAVALAQSRYQQRYLGRMHGLLVAVVGLMLLEVLLVQRADNMVDAVRNARRIATARYAVMAVWLAMLLAVPSRVRDLPTLFTLMVLIAAAAVAFAPLGNARTSED